MSREPGKGPVGTLERDAAGPGGDAREPATIGERMLRGAGEVAALGSAIGPGDGHDLVGERDHAATIAVGIQPSQPDIYSQTTKGRMVYSYSMADTLQERIMERLKTLGMTAYAASMKASEGRSKEWVGNILNGRSGNPRSDTLQLIATALETSVDWLLHGDGPAAVPRLAEAPKSNVRVSELRFPTGRPAIGRGSRDIPVMGTAAGSLGRGAFRIEGGIIDYVLRPAVLENVKDAYGIYVEGDSMDPAHPHGELRIIHPHRPCQIGDTVVIVASYSEDGPHEAWIKRLVKRTGDKIVVEQFNPKATIEFDRRFVLSCHKVLTMNDLLGI